MTHCEYCDYYKAMDNGSNAETGKTSACLFTDFIFAADMEKSGMEYPCKDVTYQDYLNKSKKKLYASPSVLKNDDWKFAYKSRHPVPERQRTKSAG